MTDEPDWVAAIPDERDREALRAVLRRRAMEPLFDSPPLCERCGHPIEDHSVFGSEPDPAVLARVTEARFPGLVTSGLYCPHLDMVAGEDLRMPSVPPRRRLVRIYHTVTFEEYEYPESPGHE